LRHGLSFDCTALELVESGRVSKSLDVVRVFFRLLAPHLILCSFQILHRPVGAVLVYGGVKVNNLPMFFGDSRIGNLRGPDLVTFDLALQKNFKTKEQQQIEFRAEMFNHPNSACRVVVHKSLSMYLGGPPSPTPQPTTGKSSLP
jgi:hypothetical protein